MILEKNQEKMKKYVNEKLGELVISKHISILNRDFSLLDFDVNGSYPTAVHIQLQCQTRNQFV